MSTYNEYHYDMLKHATDITIAMIHAQPQIPISDIIGAVGKAYDALAATGIEKPTEAPTLTPAVPIRSSVKPDYIVCLEDGAKLKMLKRYLRTRYDMSPEEYRARWNLPGDYPLVAPNYANVRRDLALKIGLGRKKPATPTPLATPTKRSRKV